MSLNLNRNQSNVKVGPAADTQQKYIAQMVVSRLHGSLDTLSALKMQLSK